MAPLNKKLIIALLRQHNGPLHFAGLMRSLGGRHIKRELKHLLDDMAGSGELVRLKGNSYAVSGTQQTVSGRISVHRDGYGFVTPAGGGEDIFIPSRAMGSALHGDLVEVTSGPSRMGGGKRDGRVVQVAERATTRIVGRYEENRRGAVVIPDDPRLAIIVSIPPAGRARAEDGHQVVVELTSYPAGGRPATGQIVEVLGWPDDPDVEVQSVIRRFGLPHEFSQECLAQAEAVPEAIASGDLQGRVDLRGMQTVTIDGETARDFDDAVSLRREGDTYRLWVSIADVSHYVKPGSPLDRDAYLRGTSVYFPDRCIPMLPERLSNGICSLNPAVERLTMTAEMLFDLSGNMLDSRFYHSVIRSSARLTYTTVKQVIVDNDSDVSDQHRPLVPMLTEMKELALILMAMRKKRGSIDFDLPEPEIIIGLTGQTEGIIRAERNLAHQLIEEFMLAANEAVARFVSSSSTPFLYRIHENPDPAKLQSFQEFIYGFGYEFRLVDERVDPAEIQRLLAQAEGRPEERMLNYALLRCMKQARYAAENLGHFGLASGCYCHFTSPIRRYPDLVVHRILTALISGGKRGDALLSSATANLAETAEHTSRRERIAMEAERDVVEMKKLQYMQKHVGDEFNGCIAGVTGFGFFVELDELFVEGLVHISTLADDVYAYDEKRHCLTGHRLAKIYRIGDTARVRVAAVNPGTRRIEFVLVSHTPASASANPPASVPPGEEYRRVPIRGKKPAGSRRGSGAGPVNKPASPGKSGRNKPGGRKRY